MSWRGDWGAVADEVITKFLEPMPWSWSDLEGIGPAELYYGEIVGNAAGELTFCSNRHPTGLALGLLKRHEQAAGVVMQLRFLMTSFRRNVNELFSRYDLSEDGVVKTDLKGLPDVHFEASSLVYDVIVSGRRLVDHVEIALKSIFGAESEEYCTWREFASGFYDNCLPYALCYRLRNVIEHGFVAISTVNFNPRAGTVGLAINLEAGILQYEDLNAGLRDRLVE